MPITFPCPRCGQRYQVNESLAGRRIKCKKCESVVPIPAPSSPTHAKPTAFESVGFGRPGVELEPPPTRPTVAPARPVAPPTPAESDIYDLDEPPPAPSAHPYSLDGGYAPPRAALVKTDEEDFALRPGTAKRKRRRREPAGFWLRVVASLVDSLVTLVIVVAIMGAAFAAAFATGPDPDDPSPFFVLIMIGYGLALLAVLAYNVLMIGSSKQATLGKLMLGLRVTDLDGDPLSFGRALGRELAKMFLTGMIPLGLGFLMAAFTENKQALHDMVASTLVVQDR